MKHLKLDIVIHVFFVENKAKNSYTNIDLTIGGAFKQSKEDFESWLDGTEVTTATETQTTHAVPYVYELAAGGEVVITGVSGGYIGCFEVNLATE